MQLFCKLLDDFLLVNKFGFRYFTGRKCCWIPRRIDLPISGWPLSIIISSYRNILFVRGHGCWVELIVARCLILLFTVCFFRTEVGQDTWWKGLRIQWMWYQKAFGSDSKVVDGSSGGHRTKLRLNRNTLGFLTNPISLHLLDSLCALLSALSMTFYGKNVLWPLGQLSGVLGVHLLDRLLIFKLLLPCHPLL